MCIFNASVRQCAVKGGHVLWVISCLILTSRECFVLVHSTDIFPHEFAVYYKIKNKKFMPLTCSNKHVLNFHWTATMIRKFSITPTFYFAANCSNFHYPWHKLLHTAQYWESVFHRLDSHISAYSLCISQMANLLSSLITWHSSKHQLLCCWPVHTSRYIHTSSDRAAAEVAESWRQPH